MRGGRHLPFVTVTTRVGRWTFCLSAPSCYKHYLSGKADDDACHYRCDGNARCGLGGTHAPRALRVWVSCRRSGIVFAFIASTAPPTDTTMPFLISWPSSWRCAFFAVWLALPAIAILVMLAMPAVTSSSPCSPLCMSRLYSCRISAPPSYNIRIYVCMRAACLPLPAAVLRLTMPPPPGTTTSAATT